MPKRARSYKTGQLQRLKDPVYAAQYVNAAIEAGDQDALLLALRNVAEARGINTIAKKAGLSRESVDRMISETGNPCYTSLFGILGALDLQFRIQPTPKLPDLDVGWPSPNLLWEVADRPFACYFSSRFHDFAQVLYQKVDVEHHPVPPSSDETEVLAYVA